MIGDRKEEVMEHVSFADKNILRVWQMSAGADGNAVDKKVADLCIEAQVLLDEIRAALK